MILSKETYRNNKKLIDALLNSSMHHGGEPVKYMNPGYYPQPDLAATMGQLISTKYATGGVTNITNTYNRQKGNATPDAAEMITVLYAILGELQNQKNKKIIVDLDGALQMKEAIDQLEKLESAAMT